MEFELKEIVRAEVTLFKVEKSVTAYISAIDQGNKMCEIVFLHNVHMSEWVPCDKLHHIEHVYGENEDLFEIGDIDE